MKEITPVFVLGLQRSGTTWLANALSGHPAVVAVTAEDHRGVHESVFFSHFAREYGSLSDEVNFERFARDFTASDYFILTGIPETWFRERRPTGYPEAFGCLMDEYARRNGAHYWLEKSPHHTLLSRELAEAFPSARFICVVRDPFTLIRSRLWMSGRRPSGYARRLSAILRGCSAVSLYQRHLAYFCESCDRAMLVTHEEMIADLEGTLKRAMAFLGEEFDRGMLEQRFSPNTSFASKEQRRHAMGRADKTLIRAFSAVLRFVPLGALRKIAARRNRAKGVDWPPWCWKRRSRPSASPRSGGDLPGDQQVAH